MTEGQMKKRLAAIMHADVAGYARLTDEYEEDTHRLLSQYLDRITELIGEYNGEVSNFAGDAVLAVFPSAVETLRCALAIQQNITELNSPLPQERRVQFRIGINVGDIIQDRDDVYGNGVNVAARLESLADPGGICISEAAQDAIGTKLPLRYQFLGEKKVKNIKRPIRLYRVLMNEGDVDELARRRRRLRLAAAVLVSAAVIAPGVVLWVSRDTTETLDPRDVITYAQLTERIPGTEKGTWQNEGQWVWFAEYFGSRSEADGSQPLHGLWGSIRNTQAQDDYTGRWIIRLPVDGQPQQCVYYEPELTEECYRYYSPPAEADVEGLPQDVMMRFGADGRCEGVTYFESGDTTDNPVPAAMGKLVSLSRLCTGYRAPE
jgi:class 3 adenylate cyclase